MWKTYYKNVVFLHLLVYRGYIWMPVLAKQAFLTKFLISPIIKFFVFYYKL